MRIPFTKLAVAVAVLLAAVPLAAEAQPTTHRVGVLAQELQPRLLETLRDELQRLGYSEGRNIAEALFVMDDGAMTKHRKQVAELAALTP